MIRVTSDIFIDDSEIKEEFTRAGGPGGQHVKQVSTAVKLRFNVRASRLPEYVKKKLAELGGTRVTGEGVLIISSKASRSREVNRIDATEKLVALIMKATEQPKLRVKTRISKTKKAKRLDEKKVRATTKKMRGKVRGED